MENYNLFLDDIRDPILCLNYKTQYMPENRRVYSMEEWVVVRSHQEFVKTIESGFKENKFPKLISFDHDLAWEHYQSDVSDDDLELFTSEQLGIEETGNDSAKWLVQFCIDNDLELPDYYVHSANPTGRDRINKSLQDYYKYKERFKK